MPHRLARRRLLPRPLSPPRMYLEWGRKQRVERGRLLGPCPPYTSTSISRQRPSAPLHRPHQCQRQRHHRRCPSSTYPIQSPYPLLFAPRLATDTALLRAAERATAHQQLEQQEARAVGKIVIMPVPVPVGMRTEHLQQARRIRGAHHTAVAEPLLPVERERGLPLPCPRRPLTSPCSYPCAHPHPHRQRSATNGRHRLRLHQPQYW